METRDLLKISASQWGQYKIKGKSVVYNQLVRNGNFESKSNWILDGSYEVENGIATITGNIPNTRFRQAFSNIVGHKYLFVFDILITEVEKQFYVNYGIQHTITASNEWQHLAYIDTATSQSVYINFYFYGGTSNPVPYKLKNVMIIDLTELGLDSITTLTEFYATELGKIVKNGVYLPYSATNTILSVESPFTFHKGVEMSSLLGKQNEETNLTQTYTRGDIFPKSNGTFGFNSSSSKSISFVANHKYFVYVSYDFKETSISSCDLSTPTYNITNRVNVLANNYSLHTFTNTATETVAWFRTMYYPTTSGTQVFDYVAKQMIIIDLTEIGLDNLTAQEFYNQYKNQFDKLANGQTINKPITTTLMKSVDLGSLDNWGKNVAYGHNEVINTGIGSLIKKVSGDTEIANMTCSIYTTNKRTALTQKQIAINAFGTIIICDDTLYAMTAEQIKSALSGVILYYEPAEPLTLKSVGNIFDTWTNTNGKVEKKVGIVDLGTLNWSYNSALDHERFYFNAKNINLKGAINGTVKANIICAKYITQKTNDTQNKVIGIGAVYINDTNTQLQICETNYTNATEFKNSLNGVYLIYELAIPTTEQVSSVMLPRDITKITDKNGIELESYIGIQVPYNQLITDANITKSLTISSSPSANQLDPYIMIKEPNLVGHRVYAKITTSNPKLRVGWYKTLNTGYDFATGTSITASSALPSATEGIYEITQDMVHSGTNYLQLYFFKANGLETGTHTITIQLIDLTQLGMGNIINLPIFKATQLGKVVDKGIVFEFTGTTNKNYSC